LTRHCLVITGQSHCDSLRLLATIIQIQISNLNFISKVLEHLILSWFQPHILASSKFNKYQSAYRPGCSTETALQLLLDHIYCTADEGRPALLISLDMSAAFDTVLIKRLSCSFGIPGNVHCWTHSYLTGRTQSVRISITRQGRPWPGTRRRCWRG